MILFDKYFRAVFLLDKFSGAGYAARRKTIATMKGW